MKASLPIYGPIQLWHGEGYLLLQNGMDSLVGRRGLLDEAFKD